MNSKIQRIAYLINNYLDKTQDNIFQEFGQPNKNSDHEILFYNKSRYIILKEEIVFFMKDKRVIDIAITDYVFGKAVRNIFYLRGEMSEYKIIELF